MLHGGWTPPRARSRLDRELNTPSSEVPPRSRTSRACYLHTCSPDRGIECTDMRRRTGQRRIHATTRLGITPRHCSANRHCATLCGMASDDPVALCHPLLYGRRAAPSKEDCGALEGKTDDYSTPAQDYAVMSGRRDRSPPSPSVLCGHPRRPEHHPRHCITIPNTVGG
jgi:hypothetical protein